MFVTAHAAPTNLTVKVCFLDIGFGKFTNKSLTGVWQKKIIRALENTNTTLAPVFSPRERCLNALLDNQVDAVLAGYSKERSQIGVFPMKQKNMTDSKKRVGQVNYSIYRLKTNSVDWDGQKFHNLKTKNIGVQRGINSKYLLAKHGISDYEEVNAISQGIAKVSYGRNEIFIGEEYQSDLALADLRITNINKIPKPFYQDMVYVIFSKNFYQKNKKFSEKFWNELEKLHKLKEFSDAYNDNFSFELNHNLSYQGSR